MCDSRYSFNQGVLDITTSALSTISTDFFIKIHCVSFTKVRSIRIKISLSEISRFSSKKLPLKIESSANFKFGKDIIKFMTSFNGLCQEATECPFFKNSVVDTRFQQCFIL